MTKKNEGLNGSEAFEFDLLQKMIKHPLSLKTDEVFASVIPKEKMNTFASSANASKEKGTKKPEEESGELSLDEGVEFDLGSLTDDPSPPPSITETAADSDLDLNLNSGEGMTLSLGDEEKPTATSVADEGLSLGDADDGGLELSIGDEPATDLSGMDFGNVNLDQAPAATSTSTATEALEENDFSLDSSSPNTETKTRMVSRDSLVEADLSDDVKNKLAEIDAIMDSDSRINIERPSPAMSLDNDSVVDESLVLNSLSDEDLGFTSEAPPEDATRVATRVATKLEQRPEEKPKRKKKELSESSSEDIREISGAYSGELERLQATISNLRADRDELLSKIQLLEDEKVMHNRQTLTIRAELDERKIELSIIRRKLNDEITELKDKMRVHEERRLILEEKNRVLQAEVEKASQKNKLDVKKVQLRERELEQKLELLKADAETQIRHRDLKILELKRKIDAMEFDMESMNSQEKRSVESRFELEDKLEKAIRTLRSAITVLEDENDSKALEALKKNIDI